jgi:hypothetical protein
MRTRVLPVMVLAAALAAGCHAGGTGRPGGDPAMERWTETQLFFGLSKRDGSVLTDAEWQSFANELTATFPDGLTILKADGLYVETRGGVREPRGEPSRVVLLCYPAGDPTAGPRINTLCEIYMRRFDQLNVLRVDLPAGVRILERAAR